MAKSKGRRLAEWLRNLDSDSKASSTTLADDSVTAAKIADDAVTNAAIADGAVHTANLADANVTFAKLHTDVTITSSTGISASNDNNTTVPTTAALIDYVGAQIQTKDNSDEITEGSTNLYFTNARGRSALSVTTNSAGTAALVYNSSTGVFSYTPPDLSSYLTSYTETDTLDSVTGRGNSTSNSITVGNATITGNLTVQGTTTTLETATLNVEDKNITLNYSTGDSSGSADGAGITIQDAVNSTTDATILWDTTNDEFDFSHAINVNGKITANNEVRIDNGSGGTTHLNYQDGGANYIRGTTTYVDTTLDLNQNNIIDAGSITATGTISLSAASGAELRVKDTTNNAEVVVLAQDSDGWIGTKTNHILKFGTNYGGKVGLDTTGNFYPLTDSSRTLGTSSLRWSTLYVDAIDVNGNIILADNSYLQAWNSSSTSAGGIRIPRGGHITFYGSSAAEHSIGSRDNTGTVSDDLRISSYGGVWFDLDSNSNNSSAADFTIGKHGGGTGTLSTLVTISGENGSITASSGVITASGGNSTNWNTAYGWGNHASAGYLTSFDITTQTDSKYVRSDTSDTMSGSFTATGEVNAYSGSIDLRSDGIYFESGDHCITWNDGNGNFNIRVGNGPSETATEAGYIFHDEWSQSSGWRQFNISSASLSVGNSPTWRTQIYYDYNEVSLGYQGSEKLATTSAGVDVTGDFTNSADIQSKGQIRAQGWWNTPTGGYGDAAVEIGMSSGDGYILSYDRNAGSYGTLNLQATSISLVPVSSGSINLTAGTTNIGGTLDFGNVRIYADTHRAGLLAVTNDTGSWSGIQIINDGYEHAWMANTTGEVGLYNDNNNEWMIYCTDNAGVDLYHNNNVKLSTTSTGIDVTGGIVFDGGTLSGVLKVDEGQNGNIIYEKSGNGGYVPLLAQAINSGGTQTGAIKIDFGISGRADMIAGWIDIFNYTSGDTISIQLGGYLYQAAGQNEWVNESVTIFTNNANNDWTVRFGHDGTSNCIWIGELNTSWSYSQISARDWTVGYTADVDQYDLEPTISYEASSFAYVDATHTNNLPHAKFSSLVNVTTMDAAWYNACAHDGSNGILQDTAVQIHGSGYLKAAYLNMTHSAADRNSDTVFFSTTDDYIRKNTAAGFRSSLGLATVATSGAYSSLSGTPTLGGGTPYLDLATGDYGTVKVDDDRGVTWAGYAIRDDWVFMSNGATSAGIYNDTDNEWMLYFTRNAATDFYYNGTSVARTTSVGLTVNSQIRSDGTYLDVKYNDTGAGGVRLYDSQGVIQSYWYANGAGEGGLLDNDGAWFVRARTGTTANEIRCDNNNELQIFTSYVRAVGSMRSPIFYDYNNTSYYAHLDSTSDSIRAAGNIVAYYSDERLKDISGNIENALDKVCTLDGFYYRPNELAQKYGYKDKQHVGLSAQQVQKILPEVIKSAPVDSEYMTVDYASVVPLLVEAIKELKAEIEELKK